MNTNTKKLLAGLTLTAAGIAMGWGLARWKEAPLASQEAAAAPDAAASAERKVLYWYDPMVPTQKFEKPGKSPFMDMALVPKYADEGGAGGAGVSVSPQAVQSLGLRTASVEQKTIAASIDVAGTVLLNERDVSLVQARSAGFVERVYARAPGDVIAAGSPLVDLLLPEWVSAQREFLAVKALKDVALTHAARQRLLLLGMPEALVARVESSGEPQGRYTVSCASGGLGGRADGASGHDGVGRHEPGAYQWPGLGMDSCSGSRGAKRPGAARPDGRSAAGRLSLGGVQSPCDRRPARGQPGDPDRAGAIGTREPGFAAQSGHVGTGAPGRSRADRAAGAQRGRDPDRQARTRLCRGRAGEIPSGGRPARR